MKSKTLHLAFCANERFAPGLKVAVLSALKTLGPEQAMILHVIDAGLEKESRKWLQGRIEQGFPQVSLSFIEPPEEMFLKVKQVRYHLASYLRLALPEVVRDAGHLLYLDSDVIVFRDVSEIFHLHWEGGNPVTAVPDWETKRPIQDSAEIAEVCGIKDVQSYFNAGVISLDLRRLREEGFTSRACQLLTDWGEYASFADQSAFNALFPDRWTPLDLAWNVPSWDYDQNWKGVAPAILHYTNSAPWLVRTFTPSQALFERVAAELEVSLPVPEIGLVRSVLRAFFRWLGAPGRAALHWGRFIAVVLGFRSGKGEGSAKIALHWTRYFLGGPFRVVRYYRRIAAINQRDFKPFLKSVG